MPCCPWTFLRKGQFDSPLQSCGENYWKIIIGVNWWLMKYIWQTYLLTKKYINVRVIGITLSFVSRAMNSYFQTTSALDPQGQLWPYFILNLLGLEEQNFIQMVSVCWPRKTLRKSSFPEPRNKDLETLYKASMTWGLSNLFKWWSQVDLCFSCKKGRLSFLCIYNGKILKVNFPRTV